MPDPSTTHRWTMLGIGVFAQATAAVFVNGAAFLLPELTKTRSLAYAGTIVTMAPVGLMLTLVIWGYILDRTGERFVLTTCLALVCAASVGGMFATSDLALGAALLAGGLSAAGTNAASGRVVVGWFAKNQRGLAMGIRQSSLPLGISAAAFLIPTITAAQGISGGMAVPAVLTGLGAIACFVGIVDPPRPKNLSAPERVSPYRSDRRLVRIHLVSAMLVVPQVTLWTFALLWLNTDHGWTLAAAGALITLTQILGAFGRVGAGMWSDRLGSRMVPLRLVAIAAAVSMAVLAFTDFAGWPIAVAIMVVASVITVADNGLAYTAVAEISGPFWSGRSLGLQNTGQYALGAAVAPVFGAVIDAAGYPVVFALCAGIAAAAIPFIPGRDNLNL